jgi:hypothetical protein
MTTYHVTNWGEHYENNRSRKVKDLAWVPIPNKHDGERYSRLMQRKDAAQIFAAWILILQVASRCQDRGTLVRSDGSPHDSDSLSVKTRAPKAWFDLALPILVEMKWLSAEKHEQSSLALDCHDAATVLPPSCQHGDEERKKEGKEWKEGKKEPPAAPEGASDGRHHEICQRWGPAYHAEFQIDYAFAPKDAAFLKRFLESNKEPPDAILGVASQAWKRVRADRFAKHCKAASTIHGLCTFYNEIRVELKGAQPPNGESDLLDRMANPNLRV